MDSQNKRVLAYMKEYGGITSLEAYTMLGCSRLAARISDLRRSGHNIESKFVTRSNRFGEPVRYCEYRLAKKNE